MPFCEDCAKYWTPSAMNADGTCPTCGRVLEAPSQASTVSSANAEAKAPITAKNLDLKKLAAGDAADEEKAPWHFKLLVVLLVVYLTWRIVGLIF